MEAVGPVLEVCSCIWGPVSRRIGYVSNLKKNFEELKWKVQMLRSAMEDVNRKITRKKPTSGCEFWLKEANNLQNKWKETEEEYQKNMTCLGGWCPNVSARLNLGKRVVELMTEIEEKSEFKGDLVINEPEKIMLMPKPRAEVNTATEHTLQELLGMVKEISIQIIGLWGMGGIGKSTIMKLLLNRPEIQQMFDIVLWVVVSKEGTDRKVQDELARRLNVEKQESESSESLQSKVYMGLKGKKFLLLLDDVWDDIDLEEVGVPLADEEGKDCKVVLSTRFLSVCRKMRTEKDIEVKALSDEEAWSLFRREAGEVVNDSRIEALARKVTKECCGLPLAITVLAGALRKEEDIHVWRNAVQVLRLSVSNEIEDMEARVYGRLQYSYDRLKDARSKDCFLFCALFPEDWDIPKVRLTQYWVNEGLIGGWNNLEEAKDKGFSKLKELEGASLLLSGEIDDYDGECVKMHDVMRDLALRISSTKADGSCKSFVKVGDVESSDAPKAEHWENVKWISLMENDLTTLPQMPPNCRMLTTLLLQGNANLVEIPPYFFEHMPALRVLDLSKTGIHFLPPSIGRLANLRGLYLNDCKYLGAIPSEVGALVKLEIFQMKGYTQICSLPLEIEDLASLRHLEVAFGTESEDELAEQNEFQAIKMFPKLSKLFGLERLGIYVRAEDAEWWGNHYSEEVSEEICRVNSLTHLSFAFSKIEHLQHFIRQSSSWKRRSLTTFRLVVGEEVYGRDVFEYYPMEESYLADAGPKGVIVYNDDTKMNVSDEMRQILTRADTLVVCQRAAVQSLSEFGLENMNELKYCSVVDCRCMETIISMHDDEDRGNGKQNSDPFRSLKILCLGYLPNLKSIWEGPLPSPPPHGRRFFPSLTDLRLSGCNRLKCVFSRGLISHLSNLERLRVEWCKDVEEIISSMEQEGGGEMLPIQILLPRLKQVSLRDLPNLRCICSNKELSSAAAVDWPSFEKIEIDLCQNLKGLPRGFAKAVNLKIHCRAGWWETVEREDDAFKQQLCSKVVIK